MSTFGQQLPYIVAAAQPFKGPLRQETCPLAYASNSAGAAVKLRQTRGGNAAYTRHLGLTRAERQALILSKLPFRPKQSLWAGAEALHC